MVIRYSYFLPDRAAAILPNSSWGIKGYIPVEAGFAADDPKNWRM